MARLMTADELAALQRKVDRRMKMPVLKEQELMSEIVLNVEIVPMSPVRRAIGVWLIRLARWVLGCKSDIWAEVA